MNHVLSLMHDYRAKGDFVLPLLNTQPLPLTAMAIMRLLVELAESVSPVDLHFQPHLMIADLSNLNRLMGNDCCHHSTNYVINIADWMYPCKWQTNQKQTFSQHNNEKMHFKISELNRRKITTKPQQSICSLIVYNLFSKVFNGKLSFNLKWTFLFRLQTYNSRKVPKSQQKKWEKKMFAQNLMNTNQNHSMNLVKKNKNHSVYLALSAWRYISNITASCNIIWSNWCIYMTVLRKISFHLFLFDKLTDIVDIGIAFVSYIYFWSEQLNG